MDRKSTALSNKLKWLWNFYKFLPFHEESKKFYCLMQISLFSRILNEILLCTDLIKIIFRILTVRALKDRSIVTLQAEIAKFFKFFYSNLIKMNFSFKGKVTDPYIWVKNTAREMNPGIFA